MKLVVMDTEGNSAFVPILSTIAIPVEISTTTGSNHDCAIRNSTSAISTAAIIITDTGGVAPSWLVSTTQLPPKRLLICLPSDFWSTDLGTSRSNTV